MIWAVRNREQIGEICSAWGRRFRAGRGAGQQAGGWEASHCRINANSVLAQPQNLSASGPLRGHTRFLRNM